MPPTLTRRISWQTWYDFDRSTQTFRPVVQVRGIYNGNFVSSGFQVGQLSTHTTLAPSGRYAQKFVAQGITLALPFTYPSVGTTYYPDVVTTTIDGKFAWKYDFDSVLPDLGDFNPSSLIGTQSIKPAFGLAFERNPDVTSPAFDGYYRITSITEPTNFPAFLWGRATATGTGEAVMQGTTNANSYAAFSLAPRCLHDSTSETESFKDDLLYQLTIDPQDDSVVGSIYGYATSYHLSTNGFFCY